VQDLAWLGIPTRVVFRGLVGRKHVRISTAICGRNASDWKAEMSESRPNRVANHGTPADT
jgi:hypothetical protein